MHKSESDQQIAKQNQKPVKKPGQRPKPDNNPSPGPAPTHNPGTRDYPIPGRKKK